MVSRNFLTLLSPPHKGQCSFGLRPGPLLLVPHTCPGQTLQHPWTHVHLSVDCSHTSDPVVELASYLWDTRQDVSQGPQTQPFESETHCPSLPCKPASPRGMLSQMTRPSTQSLKQAPCCHSSLPLLSPQPNLSLQVLVLNICGMSSITLLPPPWIKPFC